MCYTYINIKTKEHKTMDKFKKIASLEELEALKELIHYENSGEHKPQDKREKILVDFTKPVGRIKAISESAATAEVTILPVTNIADKDLSESFKDIILKDTEKGTKYFEISSPDGTESIPCRTFFEIYANTMISLKKEVPDIKLGAGGFDNCVSDYVHEFMNYLSTDKRVALDFFSWHKSCAKAEQLQNYTFAARTLLDKYGFENTENIITSWSYNGNPAGIPAAEFDLKKASFTAACLISMQKTPTNIAVFSEDAHNENSKVKSAFKAFAAISDLGIEVTSDTAADHIYVVGAKNDDKGAFMMANFNPYEKLEHELVFDLKGVYGKKCEMYLADSEHDLDLIYEGDIPETYKMMPETIVLVKLV